MNYPDTETALRRLEAAPAAAAAFDAATRREMPKAASRREAVAATLDAIKATQNELNATREKLIAAKNRLAALEVAKAKNERLRAELAATRARLAKQPTAAPGPFAAEPTDSIVRCLRRGWFTPAQAGAARAELTRRGVVVLSNGFTQKVV